MRSMNNCLNNTHCRIVSTLPMPTIKCTLEQRYLWYLKGSGYFFFLPLWCSLTTYFLLWLLQFESRVFASPSKLRTHSLWFLLCQQQGGIKEFCDKQQLNVYLNNDWNVLPWFFWFIVTIYEMLSCNSFYFRNTAMLLLEVLHCYEFLWVTEMNLSFSPSGCCRRCQEEHEA